MSHVQRAELPDQTVRASGGRVRPDLASVEVPATVPGSVHTDLLGGGHVDDPCADTGEQLRTLIGLTDLSSGRDSSPHTATSGTWCPVVLEGITSRTEPTS